MTTALAINNLIKIYPNGTQALHGISFSVEKGDFFALLGPNGAGKSTTIGIMTTLIPKSRGEVSIFDHDIEVDLEKVKSAIGVVPQEFNFNVWETAENILYDQAGYYGISRRKAKSNVEHYLKQLGLWEKRKTKARTLSGGMKRRLMIARALVHDPEMLILDEPTAGVDIEIRRSMWQFLINLNQKGTTIILTTHYLEEAEQLCRNIAIIDQGRIVKHSSMQSLLRELKQESFIFDLDEPCLSSFNNMEGYSIKQLDPLTLEVTVHSGYKLNTLFTYFNEQGISIKSMRNKSNRLETLFLELTQREGNHDVH